LIEFENLIHCFEVSPEDDASVPPEGAQQARTGTDM